jgi:hypothetical protein
MATTSSLSSALRLALISIACLIICIVLILVSFNTISNGSLVLGVLIGITGLVLAIISAVKAIKTWKLMATNSGIASMKWQLVVALIIDMIYAIIIILFFAFIIWLFIGYRHGL